MALNGIGSGSAATVDTIPTIPEDVEEGQQSNDLLGPPLLPINLREHKVSIAIVWSIIVVDSAVLPVVLFYVLWFCTDLGAATTFAILTAAFGFVSVLEYVVRMWRLVRKDDNMRPIGSKRGWLDMFQIFFTIGTILVTFQLVWGTVPDEPNIRLLSMPTPTIMFMVGGLLLFIDVCHLLKLHIPIRISSLAPGSLARPGVYTVIEDVVAVDGRGGKAYRMALDARYRASPHFQRMLLHISFFWSFGALLMAGLLTAVIYTAPVEVAFGIGWGVPFIWAGIWTLLTFRHVGASLTLEKADWISDAKK